MHAFINITFSFLQQGQSFYWPIRAEVTSEQSIDKHIYILSRNVSERRFSMSQRDINLLDLPNEILFNILKKLNNMDVLYSLFDIKNQQLHIIAQDKIFTTILNFVSISSSNDNSSISNRKLDRFCIEILPQIHHNVKCLILESVSIERIVPAAEYPNVTQLKIFNFNKEIMSRYFKDDSVFQHICKQITDLSLSGNENKIGILCTNYTMNVYAIILIFFKNLKHLSIAPLSINNHLPLSLRDLSPSTFSSSTLTKLCIDVLHFDDCLALLDGRLKQLITFIVQIDFIYDMPSISYNMDDIPNLKCFSLICYNATCLYDNLIVPLLRRMLHLEELTLHVCILNRPTFVDGIHLHKEILIYMPQLHKLIFYINTTNEINGPIHRLCNDDIQRTFSNINHRPVISIVDYIGTYKAACHVFSLPFPFYRLQWITNNFPPIICTSVTHLKLSDTVPFKPEFFIRIARSFPSLKYLVVSNIRSPLWSFDESYSVNDNSCSIVEYSHLISLDIDFVNIDYVDQFLNDSETLLPCLTELIVQFDRLKTVTENFTRDATRRNCAKVKRLIVQNLIDFPEDVYRYFPSL